MALDQALQRTGGAAQRVRHVGGRAPEGGLHAEVDAGQAEQHRVHLLLRARRPGRERVHAPQRQAAELRRGLRQVHALEVDGAHDAQAVDPQRRDHRPHDEHGVQPVAQARQLQHRHHREVARQLAPRLAAVEHGEGDQRAQHDVDRDHQQEQLAAAGDLAEGRRVPEAEHQPGGEGRHPRAQHQVDAGGAQARAQAETAAGGRLGGDGSDRLVHLQLEGRARRTACGADTPPVRHTAAGTAERAGGADGPAPMMPQATFRPVAAR